MNFNFLQPAQKSWPLMEELEGRFMDESNHGEPFPRLHLDVKKYTKYLFDELEYRDQEIFQILQSKLESAYDDKDMPYVIERYLYLSITQIEDLLQWLISQGYYKLKYKTNNDDAVGDEKKEANKPMDYYQLQKFSQQSYDNKQWCRRCCHCLRVRKAKNSTNINKLVEDAKREAAYIERNGRHWCQRRINKLKDEYIETHPNCQHGNYNNVAANDELANVNVSVAVKYQAKILSNHEYYSTIWGKYECGLIIVSPGYLCSSLRIKLSKNIGTDYDLGNAMCRFGSVNTFLNAEMPEPFYSEVELQREQQRNEDDKKQNPVFTELLNEYKEIVEL